MHHLIISCKPFNNKKRLDTQQSKIRFSPDSHVKVKLEDQLVICKYYVRCLHEEVTMTRETYYFQ
uniref:Uncharacterized protein n=1 Tax=Arundo donax TaxID=35708 RepID=A0A0A9FIY3_ARUDO